MMVCRSRCPKQRQHPFPRAPGSLQDCKLSTEQKESTYQEQRRNANDRQLLHGALGLMTRARNMSPESAAQRK